MAAPTLFLGEFDHSIDDKSRLAIPARFRPALQDGLVITRGLDRCLVIWDTDSWRGHASRPSATASRCCSATLATSASWSSNR